MFHKYFYILSILITFSIFLFVNGCDSVTDSKANPITLPIPATPVDGDSTVSVTPTFTWTNNADKLQISTKRTFENPITFDVSGNTYSLPAGNLQSGTWYFWQVGILGNNIENWSSQYFSFKTTN